MKKGLLIAGVTSILACGLIVGIASSNGNILNTSKLDAANAVSTNKFTNSEEGAHLPGNAVYFVPESTVSWWTSGAETRMYFQNDDNSYFAWSDVMVFAYNRGNNSNKPVYQAIVPEFPAGSGLTKWTKFQAIRGRTGGTPTTITDKAEGDTGYIYNYSGSCDIYWSESYHNTIGFYNDGSEKNYCDTITAVERLEVLSWTQDWSKPAGTNPGFCDAEGNTDTSTLKTQWDASGDLFDTFGDDVKYYFSHVTAVADDGDNTEADVPDFAARYDWVFYRYSVSCSLSNWADRTISF